MSTNNLELALKIKVLVDGIKNVEALAAHLRTLTQASNATTTDSTSELRDGLALTVTAIREVALELNKLLNGRAKAADPTAAVREGVEHTAVAVREVTADLDALSQQGKKVDDPTAAARTGIEQTAEVVREVGDGLDALGQGEKKVEDPTAVARDGIEQTGKALQVLDAEFEQLDENAKPAPDPTGNIRRGALITVPPLDKLGAELDQVGATTRRGLPDPTPALRQGLKNVLAVAEQTRAGLSRIASEIFNLRNAIAAGVVGIATKQIVDSALAYERVERGLKAVTGSAEGGAQELAFVRSEADRLGLALQSTAEQYTQLTAAAKGTKLEGQGIRDIFSAIIETTTVLGKTEAETTGILNALQQMISKGVVSSEELRQQLGDRLPGAVQAAARALGVTTGQLNKMLEQGQILTDDFLPRFAAEYRKTFGSEVAAATTSAQADLNRFSTTIFDLKVEFAKCGFFSGLFSALNEIRDILRDPTFKVFLRDIGSGLGAIARGAAQFIGGWRLLTSGPSDGLQKLDTQVSAIDAKIKDLEEALNKPRAIRGFKVFGLKDNNGRDVKSDETLFASDEAINQRLDELRNQRQSIVGDMDKIMAARGKKLDAPPPAPKALPPFVLPPSKAVLDARLAELRATVDAQNRLIKDNLARQQELLDQQLAENLISYRAYYAQRAQLQTEAADQELAALRKELVSQNAAVKSAKAEDDRLAALAKVHKLEADIVIVERQRGAIAGKAAFDQAQAEKQLVAELTQVHAALLQAQGRSADAQALQLGQQYGELIKKLQVEGDAAGEELVRKLINVESARAQLDQLRAEYDRVLSQMQVDEQRISNNRDAGLKTELQARKEIVELHRRTSAQLGVLVPQMQALGKAKRPDAANEVARIAEEVRGLGLTVDDVAARVNGSLETGLTQFFDDIAKGTKSGKALIEDFGNSVIATINRIAAEQAATKILSALGATGIGQFVGSILGGGPPAPVHPAGGVVGAVAASRTVAPLAFVSAPRYHSGGVLGLKPDEVPAILQRGEEVLTCNDPRHRDNGGMGGSNVSVQMTINTPDADSFRHSQDRNARDMAEHARRAQERHS